MQQPEKTPRIISKTEHWNKYYEVAKLLPYADHRYCFDDSMDFDKHCQFWELASALQGSSWWHYRLLINQFKKDWSVHHVLARNGKEKYVREIRTDHKTELQKHKSGSADRVGNASRSP